VTVCATQLTNQGILTANQFGTMDTNFAPLHINCKGAVGK
jgi:hypothetical protein